MCLTLGDKKNLKIYISGERLQGENRQGFPIKLKVMEEAYSARIGKIGINPFVFLPEAVLKNICNSAGKSRGPIPVRGTVNGQAFRQTLVKYKGDWRLYVNTKMLKDSPERIGEEIEITLEFDPEERVISPHPKLVRALKANKEAKAVFDSLTPGLQREILRYISFLKTEASVDRNVLRAIDFLLGKGRFIGRDRP